MSAKLVFQFKFMILLWTGLIGLFVYTEVLALPSLDYDFAGGISVNGEAHQQQAVVSLSDTVDVTGGIAVHPDDVGKTTDIFVYAEATLLPSTEKVYFMLDAGFSVLPWDRNPKNLVAFQPNVTLVATQLVSMYSGHFIYPGTLKVFFGYRSVDGILVQNSQPIDVVINDGTIINTNLCTYDFESIDQLSFSEQTQYGETTVTTQVGCSWTASSDTDWITIVSGSEGNGTGTVTYAVVPNLGSDLKTGTVTIAGKTLTVTVSTRPVNLVSCSYEVSPISLSIPVAGDSGIINVVTQPGCDWAASSNADWIKIEWITVNHENGTGSVTYTADPNLTDSPKTGILTVAGNTVAVTIAGNQAKASCQVDTTQAPEMAEYAQTTLSLCETYFPSIWAKLYKDTFPTEGVRIFFNRGLQVPGQTVQGMEVMPFVVLNAEYLTQKPQEQNVVIHEMVHVAQSYSWVDPMPPSWVVEGMADHITHSLGFSYDWTHPTCQVGLQGGLHYTDGYWCGSAFFNFLEKTYDADFVFKLNTAIKANQYGDSLFESYTGKSLDQLWQECLQQDCVGGKQDTPTSNNEFVSTFKRVEYYKPTGYCAADMILVWFLFEATGVNTSDLLYVEEKSIYQTDPANPYVESLQAFNSEGFIVRGFCAPPGMKSDFQVRLKEKSTGRLSNVMTFTADVNSAVIDREAPALTTTPGEVGPTEPVSNDPILVSQVTNPDTELGFIGTTGKETIGIFGTKDSQGRLVGINKISFGSQMDESQNLVITLGKDYLPTTMEFPDGSKVEYSNYTSEGATAIYRRPDGSVANQAFVPMPFDDIQKGAEAVRQYVESPQPPENSQVPSTSGNESSPAASNCKEVMGAFCKQVDNLFWGASQLLSVLSCATASTAAVLTGGFAIPVAILACGSVMLNGISRMEDVIKGNTGTCGDKDTGTCLGTPGGTCIKKLKKANDLLQNVQSCFAPPKFWECAKTVGTDEFNKFGEGVVEALDPEKVCGSDSCTDLTELVKKYNATSYSYPPCMCDIFELSSSPEGKNFKQDCLALGNTKWGEFSGILQRCASPDDGKGVF